VHPGTLLKRCLPNNKGSCNFFEEEHMKWNIGLLPCALLSLLITGASAAESRTADYPRRPIRIIVPQSPGGTTDITARLVGQKLAEHIGHAVVIDNRPGAGSLHGIDLVAKAEPDGYTLLVVASSLSIIPNMYKKLPFDPVRDLAPITTLIVYPNLVVVHPSVPVKSLSEFIALAKAKPGVLNYVSGGVGTGTHLGAELFKSMAGVNIVHVPYKGGGPALIALQGGHAQLMFAPIPSALPLVKSGKLKALAVTSAKRSPAVPDLPSVAEAGVSGYDESTWNGLLAPAGTPSAVLVKIHGYVDAVLNMADTRKRFLAEGAEPVSRRPESFAALIKGEISKWSSVIRRAGIKPE